MAKLIETSTSRKPFETALAAKKAALIALVLALWAVSLALGSNIPPREIPADTILETRLSQAVSSYATKRGQIIRAVLISPVETNEGVLLPAGTTALGTVVDVHRVGLGLIRERAHLKINFDTLVLPDDEKLSMQSRVKDVENARETVRPDGRIQGIRATSSYAYRASGMLVTVTSFDPLLMLFAFSSSASILRFPESEIYYPAGTDLEVKLLQPVAVGRTSLPAIISVTTSAEEKEKLTALVAELPFRTKTVTHRTPSDMTNLIFLGSESQIEAAFEAAGWLRSAELNSHTRYEAVRAVAELNGYPEAPMSVLTLNEHVPHITYEKGLNTIAKRHHLRIWDLPETWQGEPVWTAAATHDIGIGFSKQSKNAIHLIDHNIDDERSKVVHDLVFAGCVDGAELVDRPHVPRDARNGTGEPLVTDRQIAVLRINDCRAPHLATASLDPEPVRSHGNLVQRGSRQVCLSLHSDLIRNNVGWQAFTVTRYGVNRLRGRKKSVHSHTAEGGVVYEENKGLVLNEGMVSRPPSGSVAEDPSEENKKGPQ